MRSNEWAIAVDYESYFTLPSDMKSISLVMPNSLGISINVKGENKNGSWPYLAGGSMEIKLVASNGTELGTRTVSISENKIVLYIVHLRVLN